MRKEPIVSNNSWSLAPSGLISLFSSTPVKKSHDELVNDALGLFTEAEVKMNSVIREIDADIEAEREEIKAAEERISQAVGSKSRLERTLNRLKALTA